MERNYLLNIAQGTIHNGKNLCGQAKRMKKANKKWFATYAEAVNYYEGEDKKGIPCNICLRNYCR